MSKAFDKDSSIARGLDTLEGIEKNFILLHVQFNENYPFAPPFIRVVEPMIIGGHIESGGALCMEVLMTRGWSPAYSMESLFLQIASTIARGHGKIDFTKVTWFYNSIKNLNINFNLTEFLQFRRCQDEIQVA